MHAHFRGRALPYLMIAPMLVILLVFLYWPALQTFWLALNRESIRRGAPPTFVGLENFTTLLSDPAYWSSMAFTVWLAVGVVIFGLAIALGIAMLALQNVRGARVYRALLIWPYGLSPAVTGIIFLLTFNEAFGVARWIGETVLGLQIPWLTNPRLAAVAVLMASVWRNVGFNILFYMAALQNLPREVLESAQIDGAGPLRRFWHITLPLLSPMTLFLTVSTLTYSIFDLFGLIDILTRGGPNGTTTNLVYRMYLDAFAFAGKGGMAAAQSLVLFCMVATLTVFNIRATRNLVHYGG